MASQHASSAPRRSGVCLIPRPTWDLCYPLQRASRAFLLNPPRNERSPIYLASSKSDERELDQRRLVVSMKQDNTWFVAMTIDSNKMVGMRTGTWNDHQNTSREEEKNGNWSAPGTQKWGRVTSVMSLSTEPNTTQRSTTWKGRRDPDRRTRRTARRQMANDDGPLGRSIV